MDRFHWQSAMCGYAHEMMSAHTVEGLFRGITREIRSFSKINILENIFRK